MKINLGSGYRKIPGYINIDNRPEVKPDLLIDLTKGIPFEDSSVEEVRAVDFLEHIPTVKTVPFIEEVYRVLKNGGMFESITPDCEVGQGAFQDPFHVSFWCQNSWLYYSNDTYRNLYGIKAKFRIEKMNRIGNKDMRVYHLHVVAVAEKDVKGV